MINKILAGFLILLSLISCNNDYDIALRNRMYANNGISKVEKVNSASKSRYIEVEKAINENYIKDLDSLINTSFERQLERFDDEELGFFSSYLNMISWLFSSKKGWNDDMNILSKRYFNPLDLYQEQHVLFLQYQDKIKNLRQQFASSRGLPSYHQFDIPEESISLDSFSEHTRNNIVIEFGTEVFEYLLGLIIVPVILTVLLGIKLEDNGCTVSIVIFLVCIIISIVLSVKNDNRLLDSMREQHQKNIDINTKELSDSLNKNTVHFYEKI